MNSVMRMMMVVNRRAVMRSVQKTGRLSAYVRVSVSVCEETRINSMNQQFCSLSMNGTVCASSSSSVGMCSISIFLIAAFALTSIELSVTAVAVMAAAATVFTDMNRSSLKPYCTLSGFFGCAMLLDEFREQSIDSESELKLNETRAFCCRRNAL